MKTVDLSTYFVLYNLVIGVLLVFASDRIAGYATVAGARWGPPLARYSRTMLRSFGGTVAVLCGAIYILFHLLRIGVD